MIPPKEVGPDANNARANPNTNNHHEVGYQQDSRFDDLAARSVSWWSVHEFVTSALDRAGSWPMAGTPAWCALPDDAPQKLAALLDAARHWVLRVEAYQEAQAAAAKEVSAATNWSAIAQAHRNQADWYSSRPWMKRVAA